MEWKRKPGTWQMTEHTKKGVCYVSFPLLDAERGFVHGFSTRIGGCQRGGFIVDEPQLYKGR